MTALPKQKMSVEDYFELDRNAEGNFEYFNGEVFEMSGVSPNHARVERNLLNNLTDKAFEKCCEVFPANLRVKVPALTTYRYPDLSIVCGKANFEEIGGLQCLVNPILLVEVLPEATESYDRGEKFRLYKTIESFCEYILVSSRSKDVTHFLKHKDRFWLQSDYIAGESLHITTLNFDLAVDEIYREIEFTNE